MSAIQYDPAIIEKVAQRLNARANSIVALYLLLGLLLGIGLGLFVGMLAGTDSSSTPMMVCGGLLALLGYAVGSDRALSLRLQAQVLLCQVSIERNTMGTYRWLVEQVQLQVRQAPPAAPQGGAYAGYTPQAAPQGQAHAIPMPPMADPGRPPGR